MATVTLRGAPVQTSGELPKIGGEAPGFRLANRDLKDVSLHEFVGKKKVLNIFPSIDTPVCATSVKKFNERMRGRSDVALLMIAADLPFAFKRFCGAENIDNVITLSTFRSQAFLKDYGVLIETGPLAGLAARACVVLDQDNKVIHAELVPEIGQEPDYDAALKAVA
ncbi:MAG TPA: thiol peroxidase [Nevskiaceae bacterium]|nr:thiol peroxidase [Nevskiaceae bacterium]